MCIRMPALILRVTPEFKHFVGKAARWLVWAICLAEDSTVRLTARSMPTVQLSEVEESQAHLPITKRVTGELEHLLRLAFCQVESNIHKYLASTTTGAFPLGSPALRDLLQVAIRVKHADGRTVSLWDWVICQEEPL